MSGGLRVMQVSERWAIGLIDHCVVVVWRLQPHPEDMVVRNNALREICAAFPGTSALIEVIEPSSKPPSEATRRAAMEVFRELGTRLTLCTFALEGDALKVTVARAVITAMLFFVKQPQPTKVFRDITEMLGFVHKALRLDDPEFVASTKQALETLRAQIATTEQPAAMQ